MFKKIFLILITTTSILISFFTFTSEAFAQKKKVKSTKSVKKERSRSTLSYGDPITISVKLDKPELLPKNLSPQQKRRFETFDLVWKTINNNYFDQTFGGNDWKKIRGEFFSRVLKTKDDAALHLLLQEMINRLNQSHFVVIPPEAYKEIEKAKADSLKREAEKDAKDIEEKDDENLDEEENPEDDEVIYREFGLPIDLRIIDSQVVITSIEKNSNVEKAGLKLGFVIEKVNGVSLNELILKLQNFNAYSKTFKNQMPLVLKTFLEGAENTEVEINYLNEKNESKSIFIKRQGLKGEYVKVLSGFPEGLMTFETKSINEKVGYIKFDMFALPVLMKFCEAITKFKDKESIIIDMRGNSGGALSVLFGISGLLTSTPINIGTEISRRGRENHVIDPMPKNYKGKIAILTDRQSISAAEMFSSAIKESGRGIIVGERTAGEALPSMTLNLPTGAVFIYPVSNFQSAKGRILEGNGVEPNYFVPLDRKSLLNGRDIQLDAAIKYLDEKLVVAKIEEQFDEPPRAIPPPKPIKTLLTPPKPVLVASTSVPIVTEPKQDEKALEVIGDFVKALGGEENLRKIKSYKAVGTVEIESAGTKVEGSYKIFRQAPNKLTEIIEIEDTGDIREVFDGKKHFSQSLFMGYYEQKNVEINNEHKLFADFYEFLEFKNIYVNIKFFGMFNSKGRNLNLIEATTKDGVKIWFGFDATTKFLLSRAARVYTFDFDDYQKFGNVMFPTTQKRNFLIKLKFTAVEFNLPIDEKVFEMEENCFTKID